MGKRTLRQLTAVLDRSLYFLIACALMAASMLPLERGLSPLAFLSQAAGLRQTETGTWTTYTFENTARRGEQVATVTEDAFAGSRWIPVDLASEGGIDAAPAPDYVVFGDYPTIYRYRGYRPDTDSISIEPPLKQDVPAGTPVYAVELGLASNLIAAIAIDREGNKWFVGGGVSKFDDIAWTIYTVENTGERGDQVTTITKDASVGSEWVPVGFANWGEANAALASGYVMFGDDPTIYHYRQYSDNYALKYAYQDATGWHIETVNWEMGIGLYTSLALDRDGYPHISYYDWGHVDLKYAYKDASDWHIQTVDSEGGGYTSLALDGDGYPHISYCSYYGNGNLKYAYRDASGWHIQTVDSEGWVGEYISLALDRGGYPHISYYDWGHVDLKYAYKDASDWHIQTVDSEGGGYTSLALDGDGYPHISYWDATNGDLKYAYRDASGWHIETVDTELGYSSGYASLALRGDGYPHISYRSVHTSGSIFIDPLLRQDAPAGTPVYAVEVGLASNDITAIAIDKEGNMWFGTEWSGVSKFDGATWTTYNASNSGLASNSITAIAIDREGNKWFGTRWSGVCKFNGTHWTTYTAENTGRRGNQVTIVTEDTPAWSGEVPVGFASKEEADAALWSGYVMFGDDPTVYHAGYDPDNRSIHIWPNLKQDLSAGTPVYAVELGLASNDISAIAIDKEGNMWFGTKWNGVSKFDGTTWTAYTTFNSGLASNYVQSIAIDSADVKWFGGCKGAWEWSPTYYRCYTAVVSRFDGTTWTAYVAGESGLVGRGVNAIAIDREGKKWFGTDAGVNVFDGSSWTTYNTSNSGLVSDQVNAIAVDDAGNVWIGTDHGVSKYTAPAPPPPCIDPTIIKVAERTMQMELPEFNWGEGLAAYGLLAAWQVTGDDRYFDFIKGWLDEVLDDVPEDRYWDLTSGPSLLIVYKKTGEEDYLEKAIRLANWLIENHTRGPEQEFIGIDPVSGDFIIVDGLLAVCPFLARLSSVTGNPTYIEEAVHQITVYAKHLQHGSGLFYHAYQPSTGSHFDNAFWERGNGWAALCTAEVLSFLPPDHPQRGKLIEILERQVQALAPLQDGSGLWHTVVDRSDFYLETSGALAIGYGIRQAIRDGHLSREYWGIAERVAKGARAKVAADGTVLDVSAGTGIGPDVEYYNLIPHDQIQLWGQGLYLLFACQVPCYNIYLPNVQKSYSN